MMKRKGMLLLMSCICCVTLFGCGNINDDISATDAVTPGLSATNDNLLKVGIAMTTVADFDSYMVNGFEAYQKEHADELEITIADANYDAAVQMSNVENFVSDGVDAIILKAVDAQSCAPISELCKENDIPLIVLNTPITFEYDCFVGSDNKECGISQGTYVIEELLDKKGKIAILYGDPSHDGSRGRTEGVEEVAEADNVEIVDVQTGNWARDKAMSIAENWIQSGKEIDAILANNDEMAIGAMMAYEDAGKDVVIAGVDGLPEACTLIKEERMDCSVFQDGYAQAQAALEVAMKAARGEQYDQYIDVPFQLVTQENVDDFIETYASYNVK